MNIPIYRCTNFLPMWVIFNDMKDYKNNLIVKMTFEFALKIIEFSEVLQGKKKFVVANQILRSGCAIGALVRESQNAESRADFIHKMKIAAKEAEETEYWLELCEFAKTYPKSGSMTNGIRNIIRVLGKIISTSKRTQQLVHR